MQKMIQIRHVPESIHQTLKTRASEQSLSLSDFLLEELTRIAQRPTLQQLQQRIEQRGELCVQEDSLQALHAERPDK